MKNLSKILLLILFTSFLLVSCDGLLNVDSDRYVFEDQYGMKSTNDTLYAMFGVLSQLQKLADEYVLLGELRGDLMTVTEKSDKYLKEINDFNISSDNPYANKREYYAVINNCNYIIQNIDTSLVKKGVKVMYKVYAAAKSIRAWTYMQLALNYKTAVYYTKPLLSLEDAEKDYPVYTLEELAPILIADIKPYKDVVEPSFGSLYAATIADCFFPIRFVMGDLYLWTGQYEAAANEYHDLMFKNSYLIDDYYQSSYTVINQAAFDGSSQGYWSSCFGTYSAECITDIAASNEYGTMFMLDSLAIGYQLTPTDTIIKNWNSQRYYYSTTLDTLGDLRKNSSVMADVVVYGNYGYGGTLATINTENYILKYMIMNYRSNINKRVMPYRVALLYLRYAEAVNRLGKPNLAMAVLKNGLNATNLSNPSIIPTSERTYPLPNYMDFTDIRFATNIGIRARGLGRTELDHTYYLLPTSLDSVAKINYMEDLICNEYALETAFEGNRFHDLMRIAIRRNSNAYLADKIAVKYTTNKANILDHLMNRNNWYLN
jgi:starch-binding outer membrane protein, SusD/RagB family